MWSAFSVGMAVAWGATLDVPVETPLPVPIVAAVINGR